MNRKIFCLVSVLSAMLVLNLGYVQAQTAGQIPVFDQAGTGFCNSAGGNDCIDSNITQDPFGNIGIGTSTPQNLLHVGPGTSSIVPSRVNAVVASDSADAGIAIAQNSGVNVLLQASGAAGYIGTTSNHDLVWRTNDQDRMVVRANGDVVITTGKVGIGRTDPLRELHVMGQVFGQHTFGIGVRGFSMQSAGVEGQTGVVTNPGVRAVSAGGGLSANLALEVLGRGLFTGMVTKPAGSFKIDHPLDPANKYLYHSFVESPDMMNVYNGNVILDTNGEAWVELPHYFQTLNKDFRYQLTSIGSFAPVYIAEEISGNRFKIAGGNRSGKVSWQVTGIRQDPFAEKHRIRVEEEKPAAEKGYYLHPDLYGQPQTKSIQWARDPEGMKRMVEEREQLKSNDARTAALP